MAPVSDPTDPDEAALCAVLHGYLEALDDGPAPARAELLARHPEFAPELTEFFAHLDRLDSVASALRQAAGPDPGPSDPGLDTQPRQPGDPNRTIVQQFTPPRPGAAAGPARVTVNAVLGDYELRAQIARGGMGVVWRAWQRSAAREVALKLLPAGARADEPEAVRF